MAERVSPLVGLLFAAKAYQAYRDAQMRQAQLAAMPDPTQMQFEAEAARTGGMVSELPRAGGLFSTPGMWLGILPKTVAARPKDVLGEQAALSGQMTQKAAILKDLLGERKEIGAKNYQTLEKTPAMRGMSMFATGVGTGGTGGTPELDLSAPTPPEQSAQALQAYRQTQAELARERLEAYKRATDVRANAAKRLENVPPIGSPERLKWDSLDAGAKAAAQEAARARVDMNSWMAYEDHHKGEAFFNIGGDDDLKPISKRKYRTPESAINDTVHVFHATNPKSIATINSQRANMNAIHQMDNVISVLFPVIPSTADKSTRIWTLKKWQALNATVDRYNEANRLWGERFALIMGYIRDVQQRYPTQIEMKNIGEGSFPVIGQDDRATALRKMHDLEQHLRMSTGTTLEKDESEYKDTSSKAEYNYYTYGDTGDSAAEAAAAAPVPAPPEGMPDLPPDAYPPSEGTP